MPSIKLIFVNIILLLCCFGCNSRVGVKERSIEKEAGVHKINILSSSQIRHIDELRDTLEIVSDDNLVWEPFGVEVTLEGLQKRYGNIFRAEEQGGVVELYANRNKIVLKTNEPVENAELLTEYHHTKVPPYSIKEVKISTPSIVLLYGIKVGMSKKAFFKMLNVSSDVENRVNVVRFFDPPGDMIEQSYVFKEGKLEIIEMKSPD